MPVRIAALLVIATVWGAPVTAEAQKTKDEPSLEPIGNNEARPAGFEGDTNAPRDYNTGYLSWGTGGGATLGSGNGARAMINGSNHFLAAGPEGYFILGVDKDFDVLLGGRVAFWWISLAPGVRLRYRVLEKDAFHLAIDTGAYVGFWVGPAWWAWNWGGRLANATVFASLEPGIAGSYFIKDNMEITFGAQVPLSVMGGDTGFLMLVDIQFHGGFVYTFKTINLGVFGRIFAGPSIVAGNLANSPQVWARGGGQVGIQYRY